MKKSFIFIMIGILSIISHHAHANAWCKTPKIDNYIGFCYFDHIAKIKDKTSNKFGFANRKGEVIIAAQYDNADNFSQGLSAVQLGDNWGIIDKNNQVIIPFEYEFLNSPNQYGYIRAKLNGQWGMIDKNQKTLIAFGKYDYIEPFMNDGFAWVFHHQKWGYIDSQFKEIVSPQYDTHNHFNHQLICIKKNHKHGCINKQGIEVVPFIYDDIKAFIVGQHQNKIVAYLNGEVFYFNKKGRLLR